MKIRPIREGDEQAVVSLWDRCGLVADGNDPFEDITRARRTVSAQLLVGETNGAIIAAVMTGFDGHRGWIYYLAVDPEKQGAGLGRRMLEAAEDWLRAKGVPKVLLMVAADSEKVLGFYDRQDYKPSPVTTLGKWLK